MQWFPAGRLVKAVLLAHFRRPGQWHPVCFNISHMDKDLVTQKLVQERLHPFCMVCSGSNPYGLALEFETGETRETKASFHANAALEGYAGVLHGGMIATLLDGTMTNCLFAHGIAALTAELQVRYHEPVAIGPEISLCARIQQRHPPLYLLSAELIQDGRLKAAASAKFMEKHE